MNVSEFGKRWDWVYGGFRVGQIKGIEIRIHWVLPLMWLFFFLTLMSGSGAFLLKFLNFISAVAILFGSVLLHELGHCYGAHLMGERSHRILLWPLGGLATTEGSDRSPYNEFIIVIAGPLVSLALAIVGSALHFGVVLLPIPQNDIIYPLFVFMSYCVLYTAILNWMMFLFNMLIPLFPMDSARLIRSTLSMKYDPQKVTYRILLAGFVVAGAMFMLSLLQFIYPALRNIGVGPMLLFIAMFGLQSCLQQLRVLEYHQVYTDEMYNRNRYEELTHWAFHPRKSFRQYRARRARQRRPAKVVELYSEREILEAELESAVAAEDFVKAAEVRDKLKKMGGRKRSSK